MKQIQIYINVYVYIYLYIYNDVYTHVYIYETIGWWCVQGLATYGPFSAMYFLVYEQYKLSLKTYLHRDLHTVPPEPSYS